MSAWMEEKEKGAMLGDASIWVEEKGMVVKLSGEVGKMICDGRSGGWSAGNYLESLNVCALAAGSAIYCGFALNTCCHLYGFEGGGRVTRCLRKTFFSLSDSRLVDFAIDAPCRRRLWIWSLLLVFD